MIAECITISKVDRKIIWSGSDISSVRYTVMELHECLKDLYDDLEVSKIIGEKSIELVNGFRLHYTMLDRLVDGKVIDKNIKIEV